MTALAVMLLAATAASLPAERRFFVVDSSAGPYPAQQEVPTVLVARGAHLAVYQDTREPAMPAEELDALLAAFDSRIYPQQVARHGPCPDRDGNGVVFLVITGSPGEPLPISPFDTMTDGEAASFGLRSNEGEVLYGSFRHRGNHAVWNQHALAAAFHQLLHHAHDPAETVWRRLLGNFAGIAMGFAPHRTLWGDADPLDRPHRPQDPWSEWGWPLLFLQYLEDHLGSHITSQLVASPLPGFAALDALLEGRGDGRRSADLLADFAMACWLADPSLAEGRFAFTSVVPPRPPQITRLRASRPLSGQLPVGVGGMLFLAVEGSEERPLALTLLGEAGVVWRARAVLRRHLGPDQVVGLAFDEKGTAQVELDGLGRGDELRIAVVAGPRDPAFRDDRTVTLQLGLGWVPHQTPLAVGPSHAELLAAALPAGGQAARARLASTLERLTGQARSEGTRLATRYAWAPARGEVAAALLDEATKRGLAARLQPLAVPAPSGAAQEWHNVLIDIPGSDPRRWPVVLAAHWDAVAEDLETSYLAALALHDNASGVGVALEAGAALARGQRRAPVIVALLAGGHHGAAGARALLEASGGRIATWVELDGVGIPGSGASHLAIRVDTSPQPILLASTVATAFRRVGLAARPSGQPGSHHTGVALAAARGIPTVLLRAPENVVDAHLVPVAVERGLASEDYMLLVAVAAAEAVSRLAGGP